VQSRKKNSSSFEVVETSIDQVHRASTYSYEQATRYCDPPTTTPAPPNKLAKAMLPAGRSVAKGGD